MVEKIDLFRISEDPEKIPGKEGQILAFDGVKIPHPVSEWDGKKDIRISEDVIIPKGFIYILKRDIYEGAILLWSERRTTLEVVKG
jgi:hypothetical protein